MEKEGNGDLSEEIPMMKVSTSTSYPTQKKRSWQLPTFGPQGLKDVVSTQFAPLAEPEVDPSLHQCLAKFTGHVISRELKQ